MGFVRFQIAEFINFLEEQKFTIINPSNRFDIFTIRISLNDYSEDEKNQIFYLLNIKKLDRFSEDESFDSISQKYISNTYFNESERVDGWYHEGLNDLYLVVRIYSMHSLNLFYFKLYNFGFLTVWLDAITFKNSQVLNYLLFKFKVTKKIEFKNLLCVINAILAINYIKSESNLIDDSNNLEIIYLIDFENDKTIITEDLNKSFESNKPMMDKNLDLEEVHDSLKNTLKNRQKREK